MKNLTNREAAWNGKKSHLIDHLPCLAETYSSRTFRKIQYFHENLIQIEKCICDRIY